MARAKRATAKAASRGAMKELIGECLTREDWHAMILKQAEAAKQGDRAAFALLADYAFGKTQAASRKTKTKPVQIIEAR